MCVCVCAMSVYLCLLYKLCGTRHNHRFVRKLGIYDEYFGRIEHAEVTAMLYTDMSVLKFSATANITHTDNRQHTGGYLFEFRKIEWDCT